MKLTNQKTIRLKKKIENQNNISNKIASKNIGIISQINKFGQLRKNWDSYGASTISKGIIQDAIDYVKKLDRMNIGIYYTAPSPQGEILLELRNKNKTIEIEFFQDSKKIYSTYLENELHETGDLDNETENKILTWYLN